MPDGYVLVRVAEEMVEMLIEQDPQPVVLMSLERMDDGTCELWMQTPSPTIGMVERATVELARVAGAKLEEIGEPGRERVLFSYRDEARRILVAAFNTKEKGADV